MQITASESPDDQGMQLRIVGGIEFGTAAALTEAAASIFSVPRALQINGSEVDFIDSSGVGALVTMANAAEDAGVQFALVERSAILQHVLDMMGMGSEWQVGPDA